MHNNNASKAFRRLCLVIDESHVMIPHKPHAPISMISGHGGGGGGMRDNMLFLRIIISFPQNNLFTNYIITWERNIISRERNIISRERNTILREQIIISWKINLYM